MPLGLTLYILTLCMLWCVVVSAVAYIVLRSGREILLDIMVYSFIVGAIVFFGLMALTFD